MSLFRSLRGLGAGVSRPAGLSRFLRSLPLPAVLWLGILTQFLAVNREIKWDCFLYPPAVGVTLATALLFALPPLLAPRRLRTPLILLVAGTFSALALADVLCFRYYSDLFTVRNLGLGGQAADVAGSILALLRPSDALILWDLPVLASLAWRRRKEPQAPLTRRRAAAVLAALGLAVAVFGLRMVHYETRCSGAVAAMWDRPAVSMSLGALNYHLVDVLQTVGETLQSEAVAGDEVAATADLLRARNLAPAVRARPGQGIARGKNLILIQVESLQGFVPGLRVGGVEVTPNLNRFFRECLFFPHTYVQTGLGNSADAELLALASLFPSAKGVAYTRFAGNVFHSLPSALAERGYATWAFHGDRPGFWNRGRMYPALGIRRFVSKNDFDVDEIIGLGLSDESFLRQTLSLLRKAEQPFFAFLVTLTSHYPFDFPDFGDRAPLPLGDLQGTLLGNYLRYIHYTDAQLGTFLEGLRRSGLMDRSLVALYGDHHALTGVDRGDLERLLGGPLADDTAWKRLQTVPFAVRVPGSASAATRGVRPDPVGQVDIGPTLANLLGVRIPTALGRDLLSGKGGLVPFRNGSFLKGTLWVQPDGTARDLATGAPAEGDWGEAAARVRTLLRTNDLILEENLTPRLDAAMAEP